MNPDWDDFVIPKKRPNSSHHDRNANTINSNGRLRCATPREKRSVTTIVMSSLSDGSLQECFAIDNIQMVENQILSEKFSTFKSRISTHRDETFGYIMIGSNDVELMSIVCNGISVSWSLFSDLGSMDHGVPVHQFVDQVTPAPHHIDVKMRILCLKALRGESKEVPIDSSSTEPSPLFNSHVVDSNERNLLTPMGKFRSSAVYHYELDLAGNACATPSGLLPYVVFDLVPKLIGNSLSSESPSRLGVSHSMREVGSVVLSSGMFAGSRCTFQTLDRSEIVSLSLNLSCLHIYKEMFDWKALLKLPVFMALLQQQNWGRLTSSREFHIKDGEDENSFVSYFGVGSNSSLFQRAASFLQCYHYALIGSCGETILFLIPNGQLTSILGLPLTEETVLHCIAISSAAGMHITHDIEKTMLNACVGDVENMVNLQWYRKKVQECVSYNATVDFITESWSQKSSILKPRGILRPSNTDMTERRSSVQWADHLGNDLLHCMEYDEDKCISVAKYAPVADDKVIVVPLTETASASVVHRSKEKVVADDPRSMSYSCYLEKHASKGLEDNDTMQCISRQSCSTISGGADDSPARASWMPCLNASSAKQPHDIGFRGILRPSNTDMTERRSSVQWADHLGNDLLHCMEYDEDKCISVAKYAPVADDKVIVVPLTETASASVVHRSKEKVVADDPRSMSYSCYLEKHASKGLEDNDTMQCISRQSCSTISGGADDSPARASWMPCLNASSAKQPHDIGFRGILRPSNTDMTERRSSVQWADHLGNDLLHCMEYDEDKCISVAKYAPVADDKVIVVPLTETASASVVHRSKEKVVADDPRSMSYSCYLEKHASKGLEDNDTMQCISRQSCSTISGGADDSPARASWMPCLNASSAKQPHDIGFPISLATDFGTSLTLPDPFKSADDVPALSSQMVEIIVLDSDIMNGQLKPRNLAMLLRRLHLHKLLTNAEHKVVIHAHVEDNIRFHLTKRQPLFNDDNECRLNYLKQIEYYGSVNLMETWRAHYCDESKIWTPQSDRIHCLRTIIAAKRLEHRSVKLFYLTDLSNWSKKMLSEDNRITFVDYRSWINIFA